MVVRAIRTLPIDARHQISLTGGTLEERHKDIMEHEQTRLVPKGHYQGLFRNPPGGGGGGQKSNKDEFCGAAQNEWFSTNNVR